MSASLSNPPVLIKKIASSWNFDAEDFSDRVGEKLNAATRQLQDLNSDLRPVFVTARDAALSQQQAFIQPKFLGNNNGDLLQDAAKINQTENAAFKLEIEAVKASGLDAPEINDVVAQAQKVLAIQGEVLAKWRAVSAQTELNQYARADQALPQLARSVALYAAPTTELAQVFAKYTSIGLDLEKNLLAIVQKTLSAGFGKEQQAQLPVFQAVTELKA